jgi:hypothetical protein
MVARLSQVSRIFLITDGKDGLGGTVTGTIPEKEASRKGITEGVDIGGEPPGTRTQGPRLKRSN